MALLAIISAKSYSQDKAQEYFRKANEYYSANDYINAIEYYSKTIKINPKHDSAYFFRGYSYASIEKNDEALADFSKSIEINPNSVNAYMYRGLLFDRIGRLKESIYDYSKALELDPAYREYAYTARGDSKRKLDQLNEAIEDYSKAIEINPNYEIAYLGRGIAKSTLEKFIESIYDFSKAIEINPSSLDSYSYRGYSNYRLGKFEDAIVDYSKSIEINSKNNIIYFYRGLSFTELGRYNAAINDFTKAIEIDPQYSEAYGYRGITKGKLGQLNEAIDDFSKVIELNPTSQGAYHHRGSARVDLGQFDLAIVDFTKLIELEKNSINYNSRAWCYCFMKEYEKAIIDANLSVQLERNSENLDTRATAYALNKQYENSIKDFDEAIQIGDNPLLYYKRGLVKKAINELDGADNDFSKAHELDVDEKYKLGNDPLIKYLDDILFSGNLPPILSIQDISFSKNALNASDTAELLITIKNIGSGDANNVFVNLSSDLAGLSFPSKTTFSTISKNGGSQTVKIEIKSSIDIKTTEAVLKIEIVEPNFKVKIQGKQVKFPTREFLKPELLLAKFAVIENLSSSPNNQIDLNEQVDLKFALQNIGQGNAENVNIVITNNQPGVMLLGVVDNSGNLVRRNPSFISISSGKFETITYRYFINSEFTSPELSFTIKATEKYNKYGFSQTKSVEINKVLQEEGFIRTVAKNDNLVKGKIVIEDIPDFISDVDQNIPINSVINEKSFAVVIGNENYTKEIKVKYAINDSRIFKQYLLKTIGLPVNNIRYIENATFGEMLDAVEWINDVTKAYNGQAKIIFYYAGHGMPDEQTKSAFLLPSDGNSQNPATAVKLADVYNKLTEYPSVSVTVFLDACFSGAARETDGSMLADARGVKIKPKTDILTGNLVVFSAATGDETALPYSEKRHGMFTYFLLKKLQESKGNATQNELNNYITTNVSQQSVVVNNKSQTPQVNTNSQFQNNWQMIKLK